MFKRSYSRKWTELGKMLGALFLTTQRSKVSPTWSSWTLRFYTPVAATVRACNED